MERYKHNIHVHKFNESSPK